ncbi:MAG: LuxR C-terminal-related transcriptional regulator [Ilumatobacteraceae bacterium]|nr:LuxR C-terminal-related transcriptional regulator [Ilumatobacteraceae bacterium]
MAGHGDSGLAATKLVPPTLPDRLVQRSRLNDRLDAGLAGRARLVLASAPAGSGKSTLLASWLAGRPEHSAWLQVEDGDSDPARYWTYLIASIAEAVPAVARSLEQLVNGSDSNEQMLVTAMVNQFADLAEPLIVVVDDYHLIDHPSVHRGMERLIGLCPPTVTIVVSTRVDPPFRLGRLRVRKQLTEIRGDDFRFEATEASGLLLDHEGRFLDEGTVERLCRRTEGWAAGLVLAGLSLHHSADPEQFVDSFHGDDQFVVDYMTDEFLAGEGEEQRRRLLETSVLEQFNGPLVDAVTESTGGAQWLAETARVNQLLIGLDRTGSWFRYHHLLRDLLRLEAHQALAPEHLNELHRRAAAWFEREGDPLRAIGHRLAAGDDQAAVRLMYVLGPQLISDGQIETLRGLLERIGEPATTDPACALTWGWCDYIGGRYARAHEWVETTHRLASPGFDLVITAPLRMNLALAHGDVGAALDLAREMHATDQFATHGPELATTAGGVFMWAGRTAEAREVLEIAVERSAAADVRATHVLSRIYQALNDFDDSGDTSGAERALDTAEELAMSSYYRIAPAYAIRGRGTADPASARADAVKAVDLARRIPGDLALAYTLTICGDTLIDAGDDSGRALLAEARSVIDRCPDPGIAGRFLARIESRHGVDGRSRSRSGNAVRDTDVVIEQLTERETAVLRYLPTKMSQRDIASELFVSPNTVKTHCAAIYRKLGVGDRKAAVQTARDLGIL